MKIKIELLSLISILMLNLVFTMATGCTKDRTVEDYNRDQQAKVMAEYQKITGLYAGMLTSSDGQTKIAAMQVKIGVSIKSNPNVQDGSQAFGVPVIDTTLTLENGKKPSISDEAGVYNPDNNVLHVDFQVNGSSNTSSSGTSTSPSQASAPQTVTVPNGVVQLSANADGGGLSGTLQVLGEGQAVFHLVRVGDQDQGQIDALARASGLDVTSSSQEEISSFTGVTVFNGGVSKPVHLTLLESTLTPEQTLYNMLATTKYLLLSLNYSSDAHIPFNPVIWDQDAGTITGTAVITRTIGTDYQVLSMAIYCTMPTGTHIGFMDCDHRSSVTASASIAKTHVSFDTTPTQDPVDNTSSGSFVQHTYLGSTPGFGGLYQISHAGLPQGTRTLLKVAYPVRSRLEDVVELFFPENQLYLQASIIYDQGPDYDTTSKNSVKERERGTTVAFQSVIADLLNGRLDSVSSSNATSTIGLIQQLHCTGFFFGNTHHPFACTYSSNSSSAFESTFLPN
jgi:hypothetical protein